VRWCAVPLDPMCRAEEFGLAGIANGHRNSRDAAVYQVAMPGSNKSAQLSRSDLLGGAGGRPIGPSSADDPYGTSDRSRLLAGTTTLEDGSRRLQDSQRIALETEEPTPSQT
jgi:hypothetical protein